MVLHFWSNPVNAIVDRLLYVRVQSSVICSYFHTARSEKRDYYFTCLNKRLNNVYKNAYNIQHGVWAICIPILWKTKRFAWHQWV